MSLPVTFFLQEYKLGKLYSANSGLFMSTDSYACVIILCYHCFNFYFIFSFYLRSYVAFLFSTELHQMTPWTPWIPTNQTKGGYFENRFRFMCKATVPSQSLIKTKGLKTQTRFCVDGGQCHTSGELISELDTHSPVDRVIRHYCNNRRRKFRGYCKCRTLGIFLVCHKCGYG